MTEKPTYEQLEQRVRELEKAELEYKREKAEAELQKHRDHLEVLVKERTVKLEKEITAREQAEVDLREIQ